MKVVAVLTDLMTYSRIESTARVHGARLVRVDRPADAPSDADLVLVDWSARGTGWTEALRTHAGRVILFGPHTDLDAHAAARNAGLGPMWARSKLMADLPVLLGSGGTS